MKTRSKPSPPAQATRSSSSSSLTPRSATVLILTASPARFAACEPFEHLVEPAAAGDLGEFRRVERIDRDVDPPHAAFAQLVGVAGELAAVGGQGQFVERARFEMPAERAEQGHDVAPHQRLAAGQAQFLDAEPDKGAAHPVELFEGQQLALRQKIHLFRHAIDTAEVAAVGDRYAQIGDGASKRVDHATATLRRRGL